MFQMMWKNYTNASIEEEDPIIEDATDEEEKPNIENAAGVFH